MKPHEPPRLATWLLEQFGGYSHNDAIIGDLIERYRNGGTAAWYWRQAIKAIACGERSGKLAGVAVGLTTAGSSMLSNAMFNSPGRMDHFNLFSLVAMVVTIFSVVFYGPQRRGLAWVSAVTFSMSMYAFSWWWFPRDSAIRTSFPKFAVIDFVFMLILILALGYVANRISSRLQRSLNASN